MVPSSSKENILNKIRQALVQPVPLPFPENLPDQNIFAPPTDPLDIIFAEAFINLQGKFIFCDDDQDMQSKLQHLINTRVWMKIYCENTIWNPIFSNTINLETCDAAITNCELLVARTGSIILSSAQQQGRTVSVYAPVHICIAYTNQLVYDIKDALEAISKNYGDNIPSLISFASGPSRTADIEKTLVTGVHGPKEVYLFLVDKTA